VSFDLSQPAFGSVVRGLRNKGMTYPEITGKLNREHGLSLSWYRVRNAYPRGLERWRRRQQEQAARTESAQQVLHLLPPQPVTRPIDISTDEASWQVAYAELRRRRAVIRVMHLNDVHLPFHDLEAVSLALEIVRAFAPHIVVVGSDALDYPTISRWGPDADISIDDWVQHTRTLWLPFIRLIRKVAPRALLPFIFGNHEQRAIDAANASGARHAVTSEFVRLIRADGDVFFRGNTQHVAITRDGTDSTPGLIVHHGDRTNKHAAASTQGDWPRHSVNFGHCHRRQRYDNAMSNGCLCDTHPHYSKKDRPENWQQGTATIYVHHQSGTVHQTHHDFVRTKGRLWTVHNGQVLSAPDVAQRKEAA